MTAAPRSPKAGEHAGRTDSDGLESARGRQSGNPVDHFEVERGSIRREPDLRVSVEDVSFAERELVVRVQLTLVGAKVHEGDIKTNSGRDRRISLDDELLNTLA